MSNISGIIGVPTEYPAYITPYNIGGIDFTPNIIRGYDTFSDFIGGVIPTNTPMPIYPSRDILATDTQEYSTIFYNRLLIEPKHVDFGSISGDQLRTVSIINLFLRQDLSLTSLGIIPPEGISIRGIEAPSTIYRISGVIMEITVAIDGPRNIASEIRLDFAELLGIRIITLAGNRSVLFPLEFSSPTKEQLSWFTEVMTSRNGTEQRRKLRQEPRQQYITSSFVAFPDASKIDNLMHGWRSNAFTLPLWHESRPSALSTADGDDYVMTDPKYGNFFIGGSLILFDTVNHFEIRAIADIETDRIICTEVFTSFFKEGTKVIPLAGARLSRDPSRLVTGSDGYLRFTLEDLETRAIHSAAYYPTYLGYEVYLGEALKTSRAGSVYHYNKKIEKTYYQTGIAAYDSPWDHTKIEQSLSVIKEGLQDIWEFREFIHRLSGKLTPVWMSSQEKNMRVLSVGGLVDIIEIEDNYHIAQGSDRIHIVIFFIDGSSSYHEIMNAQSISGNILLDISPSINRNSEEIDIISYMSLVRSSSDSIQFNWGSNHVMRSSLNFTGADL